MKFHVKIVVAAAAMAFGAAPALAVTSHGHSETAPGHTKTPSATTPTTPPSSSHAFGRACKAESKHHVAGTPGTPFSKCVTAMAKLAGGSTKNPRAACATESKKHVAGTPGTPFSKCVAAAAKLQDKDTDH
jgi:hypothetical protein